MPSNNNPEEIRSLIGQTFSRTVAIERANVDKENRTVSLSFSSETPVERWYGFEILDHARSAADLARLNAGGPVLVCHDRYDQVAAVVPGSAKLKDKRGVADVLFSQSQRGQEILQDVNDGIRNSTSFLYRVREMKLDSSSKGIDTYRVTKWEALEISLEPIPADLSVGVGRGLDMDQLRGLSTEEKRAALQQVAEREGFNLILGDEVDSRTLQPADTPAAENPENLNPATSERTAEMPAETNPTAPTASPESVQRASEIIMLGELVGQRDYAEELSLEPGMTVENARAQLLKKKKDAQRSNTPPAEDPQTVANRSESSHVEVIPRTRLRNFSKHEEAYRFGQFLAGGVYGFKRAAEWCKEHGISFQRAAHSESDNDSGGIWVPVEFDNTFVELREKYGRFRSFADVTPMSSDRKLRRRNKGGLVARPVGAVGTSRKQTTQKMKWDAFELIARKWGVFVKIEDELSEDAIIDYADKLIGEMSYAFSKAEDDAGFNGDGSSTYHGITGVRAALRKVHATIGNIKGLTVASGNAYSEIVKGDFTNLIGSLPEYADNDNTAFYCHRTFFWNVMVPIMIAAGGVTAKEIQESKQKMFLGYPVQVSQVLPKTEANSQICCLFGDLREAVTFGDRRGIVVRQTDSNDTDFEEDLISMKATERFDINVHDVGDTSEAGPIVGLITAAA